jgi:peptidoglycan/LPS O-acetylase OafA/YrhL
VDDVKAPPLARYFSGLLSLAGLVGAISTIAALLKGHAVYFFTAAGYVGFCGGMLALIVGGPIVAVRSERGHKDGEIIAVMIGVALALICLVLFPLRSEETQAFNFLSGLGVLFLVIIFIVGIIGYNQWEEQRRPARKACPECANTVLEAAKVCEHCGHRFAPPSAMGSV